MRESLLLEDSLSLLGCKVAFGADGVKNVAIESVVGNGDDGAVGGVGGLFLVLVGEKKLTKADLIFFADFESRSATEWIDGAVLTFWQSVLSFVAGGNSVLGEK